MQQKNIAAEKVPFTSYQKFVIFILAIGQFTVILDFMVMSPLGDMLMKSMSLTPGQFATAVAGYAISAGISGLLTAGFADKFDRKKLLLFFYTGFILGTIMCGVATTYSMLLIARIVTGIFGGVIGAVSMAIITDLFDLQHRGRVIGFAQMGFGASQVLGVPIGLYLANHWGWESPFLMIAGLSILILVAVIIKMKPVTKHLSMQLDKSPLMHLYHTLTKKEYRLGFLTMALLSLGGFMMMPFGSAYAVNNLHVTPEQLPLLFMVAGVSTLIVMPIVGKLSDKINKFMIFAVASVWMSVVVVIYTNLPVIPLYVVMGFNIMMMMGIISRMVPSGTLISALPDMQDRGAFMSVSSSLQQMAGGIAAFIAGKIVIKETKFSPLQHYNTVGYVMVAVSLFCIFLMYRVDKIVAKKIADQSPAQKLYEEESILTQEMNS